ncbi:hypothetical protein PtA15_17A74 [Puccinia triticina]|uniref:Cora-domain-containing protein n=1 Tax=Puccinia triticina TaxID=208348 RepID=A0ABY7D7P5_9BASI|nr:uncharacterized protein PtA15_17A74 [Puccinia triticina]WAQ92593.1 hypothetical protein PtA15_17A74 [Puccinia triticina]
MAPSHHQIAISPSPEPYSDSDQASSSRTARNGRNETQLSQDDLLTGSQQPLFIPVDQDARSLNSTHGFIDHRPLLPRSFHEATPPRPISDPSHARRAREADSPPFSTGSIISHHSASPRPSPAEEDVCFPSLPDDRPLLAPRHPSMASHQPPEAGQGASSAGLLPHFPFPFNFQALEEFAQAERETLHQPGFRDTPLARPARADPDPFLPSPDDELDEPTTPAARDGLILSESLRPISASKRKLALFEGAVGGLGALSLGSQTDGSAITGLSNNKDPRKPRPFRFSFYSNALPSTIHARSLAEIPGEGQSFEDLFVGHPAPSDTPIPHHQQQQPFLDIDPRPLPRPAPFSAPDDPLIPPTAPAHHETKAAGKQRPAGVVRTDEDAEASTWWLDVLSPTDAEMKLLSKVFGIHPLTTEDIQMEEAREKIELFRNYYLVCFRSFDQDPYSPTYLEPLNIYIIVFREGTLSFHFRATPHAQNVRRRIKQLKDYINVTSDWISYALIDDITDAFGPLIQGIEYEVDSIDELVLILKDVEQSDMLRRIGTCRKKVMGLLRLMGNKADVVKGLAKRCNENWSVAPKSDIGLYLSDIQDHLVTMTQNLNHYEKILSRSHSNYLAQISIEMTDANNQINDVLSKLTALGSILVPMNLVTGLWGMNVHVPGQDVAEGYAWFIAIVCALVSFGVVGAWLTLRYFKFSNH